MPPAWPSLCKSYAYELLSPAICLAFWKVASRFWLRYKFIAAHHTLWLAKWQPYFFSYWGGWKFKESPDRDMHLSWSLSHNAWLRRWPSQSCIYGEVWMSSFFFFKSSWVFFPPFPFSFFLLFFFLSSLRSFFLCTPSLSRPPSTSFFLLPPFPLFWEMSPRTLARAHHFESSQIRSVARASAEPHDWPPYITSLMGLTRPASVSTYDPGPPLANFSKVPFTPFWCFASPFWSARNYNTLKQEKQMTF